MKPAHKIKQVGRFIQQLMWNYRAETSDDVCIVFINYGSVIIYNVYRKTRQSSKVQHKCGS